MSVSDTPKDLYHPKEECKRKRKEKEKNHEMASRSKLLRTQADDRESKQERRHLSIGSRIRERIGGSGKKENVMIQDPRMGTAP